MSSRLFPTFPPMQNLYLQPNRITPAAWARTYERLKTVLLNFPTRLNRHETFDGFTPTLDKVHVDILLDEGSPEERIETNSDWMRCTVGRRICFYQDWAKQQEALHLDTPINPNKPLLWEATKTYSNDGDWPRSNGASLFRSGTLDGSPTARTPLLMVLSVLLENELPGAALALAPRVDEQLQEAAIDWLTAQFGDAFTPLVMGSRSRVLETLRGSYATERKLVSRFAHLYRKQHWDNMAFALQRIGYAPTLDFYAETLSNTWWGTFGFYDVLDPWIGATQDLTATLELIERSKAWPSAKVEAYDYRDILKHLLGQHILFTPQQREFLQQLPNNEAALSTGEEDLWGSMHRIMEMRVEICPIVTTPEELSEAFALHAPERAAEFSQLIEESRIKQQDSYDALVAALNKATEQGKGKKSPAEAEESVEDTARVNAYLATHPPTARYFIKAALARNSACLDVETGIAALQARVVRYIDHPTDVAARDSLLALSPEQCRRFIRRRLKEIGISVHPDFEEWLAATTDITTLYRLTMVAALKLYDQGAHYVRFRLLYDRKYWPF